MARTNLAKQSVIRTGLTPVFTAANVDGHHIDGDGQTVLYVKNGGASSINVTAQTPQQEAGLDVAELVVAVPAGGERIIGRFPAATFNRPTGAADAGKVYVDFSGVTSVTVAALGM